jgi:hypothetical protein
VFSCTENIHGDTKTSMGPVSNEVGVSQDPEANKVVLICFRER